MNRKNPAQRRYLQRFFPAMAAYVALLFASTGALRIYRPAGAVQLLLALLPALPLVVAIGVMGIYIVEERDEFIRNRLVTAMVAGLGIMLAVTTVWGFLENGGAAAHFPTFLTFPLWCACFGFVQCGLGLSDRAKNVA